MIINYYITNAPTQAITAYTTAMKQFGITFLPDVSGFYTGSSIFPAGPAKEFGTDNPDTLTTDYVSAFNSDPGVVGYYVQDEPAIAVQPETFQQYSLIKAADPSGSTLAVLDQPLGLDCWRDTVDVLGVDPYPIITPAATISPRLPIGRARRTRLDMARARCGPSSSSSRRTWNPRGRPSSNCTT